MSPAWIRRRALAVTLRNPRGGNTYQVLYRRAGGRLAPIESAGTFPTERLAKLRRDLVAGWLAAGMNPRDELAKIAVEPPRVKTLRQWADAYKASRVDYSASSRVNMEAHLDRILAMFGDRDPHTLTVGDVQTWVAAQQTGDKPLKPSSLSRYIATLKMLLDFAGVDPNPARDRRVKLPAVDHVQTDPPTAGQFETILRTLTPRWTLPIVTLEQTGMRAGELESLEWGDVDEVGRRFRLRAANVKTRRARWVQVPDWLMEIIADTCPREDRTETRRVFPGFNAKSAKNQMARACRTAGIPHFHPHDLRHRRGTIWHQDPAVTLREQMERGGWTRSEIAVDTYSHVMELAEVPVETLRRLLVMPR